MTEILFFIICIIPLILSVAVLHEAKKCSQFIQTPEEQQKLIHNYSAALMKAVGYIPKETLTADVINDIYKDII